MTKFYKAITFYPALSVSSKVGNTLHRYGGLRDFPVLLTSSATQRGIPQ